MADEIRKVAERVKKVLEVTQQTIVGLSKHDEECLLLADAVLAQRGAEASWRPIESGLPEMDVPVLVHTDDGHTFLTKRLLESFSNYITHWMPLPTPPTSGTAEGKPGSSAVEAGGGVGA